MSGRKNGAETAFFRRVAKDAAFRVVVVSAFSLFASAAFTAYNAFLGAVYRSAWSVAIAFYYALLTALRADVLCRERKYVKNKLSADEKETRRKKALPRQCFFLFVVAAALIAPISLMVLQKKHAEYSEIAAISVAAYTVYRVVFSAKNHFGAKKSSNAAAKMLADINLVDASVSVLTLQYALLMTFDGGITGDMFTLCALSSLAIWAFIAVFSAKSFAAARRARQ